MTRQIVAHGGESAHTGTVSTILYQRSCGTRRAHQSHVGVRLATDPHHKVTKNDLEPCNREGFPSACICCFRATCLGNCVHLRGTDNSRIASLGAMSSMPADADVARNLLLSRWIGRSDQITRLIQLLHPTHASVSGEWYLRADCSIALIWLVCNHIEIERIHTRQHRYNVALWHSLVRT